MSDIAATSTTAASSQSTATSSRTSLGANFETFLTLLTAQIQNQDPLSPMDSNQFTEQLVQFSQVEQQINTNDQLEALVSVSRTSQTSSALSYLGRSVEIAADATAIGAAGGAQWELNYPAPTDDATVRIHDSTGRVVFETELGGQTGRQTFAWDGITNSGRAAPAGVYRLSVNATDSEGERVTPQIFVNETISGISFDASGAPEFVTPGGVRGFDAIRMIRADG